MEPKDTRYAYEWFMRSEDKRYWKMTKELIEKEKKSIIKIVAVLTAISTAVATIIASFQLRKFLKP